MGKKLTKIIDIKKTDLDKFISTEANNATEKYKIDKPGQILHMRETKLIPLLKLGSEMALTSVFLSSLRLVKEFRKMFLQASDIISSGKMYVYTEVVFPSDPDSRVDGLILIEKGGIIKDAAILEMKNGKNDLEQEQVERYIRIANDYKIPKVITISNQFVSDSSQSPLDLKKKKYDATTYHFSWTSLLTFANILIMDNDTNIEDEDQVEIMKEVIDYLEHPGSGVLAFDSMKTGWKNITDRLYSNKGVKADNIDLEEAVESWIQEEKNMALLLSRELGILVTSGEKYKGDFQSRIEGNKKELVEKERLTSRLIVKDAISPLAITAYFRIRGVEMSVVLTAPQDRGLKGQIGWLKNQLDYCKTKDKDKNLYKKILGNLSIDLILKNKRKDQAIKKEINALDDFEDIKKEKVKEFEIKYFINFDGKFSSKKQFITSIEDMLIDFYSGIIQHLKKWEKPAPKVIKDSLIDSGTTGKNQNT